MNQLDLLKQLEKTDFSSISSFGDFSKLMGMLNQIEDRSVFAQFQEKIKDHPMFKEFQKTQGESLAEQKTVVSGALARLAELMEKRSTSRENTRQQQANNVVQQATYQHAMIASILDNSREPDGSYNLDKLISNMSKINIPLEEKVEVALNVVDKVSNSPNGEEVLKENRITSQEVLAKAANGGDVTQKEKEAVILDTAYLIREVEGGLKRNLTKEEKKLFTNLFDASQKGRESLEIALNEMRDKFPDVKAVNNYYQSMKVKIEKEEYAAFFEEDSKNYVKQQLKSVGEQLEASINIKNTLMETTENIDELIRISLRIPKDVDDIKIGEEAWQRRLASLKESFEESIMSKFDKTAFNPTKLMFNDITGALFNHDFISKDGKILEGQDINALIKKIENDGDVPAATLLLAQLNSPLIRTVMAIQPPERGLEALNAITGWDKITQAQFDVISQIHKEIKPSTREILKKWEQSEVVQNSFYETVKEDGVIKMKRELHNEVLKQKSEQEEMNYVPEQEVKEKVVENTQSSLSEDVPMNEPNNKLAEIKDYDKQVMTTVAKDGGEIQVNNNEYNTQKLSI